MFAFASRHTKTETNLPSNERERVEKCASEKCNSRIYGVTDSSNKILKAQRTLRRLNIVQHIKTAFKTPQYNDKWAHNVFCSLLLSDQCILMDFASLAWCGFAVLGLLHDGTLHWILCQCLINIKIRSLFFARKYLHIKTLIKSTNYLLFIRMLPFFLSLYFPIHWFPIVLFWYWKILNLVTEYKFNIWLYLKPRSMVDDFDWWIYVQIGKKLLAQYINNFFFDQLI